MDLALDPGDLRQRLANPASVAVLVAKPFEDPLRGMPLFLRPTLIRRQNSVDDPGERVQLRPCGRPAPPIPRRDRKCQHLSYRPRVDPNAPCCFPPAHTLNLEPHSRITNPRIELNAVHHPAPAASEKDHLPPDFTPAPPDCSAASVRDFCSGAYTACLNSGVVRFFRTAFRRLISYSTNSPALSYNSLNRSRSPAILLHLAGLADFRPSPGQAIAELLASSSNLTFTWIISCSCVIS